MSITLWGRLNSINVQKVVWCLHETGQPFERIDAGRGVGVNDTPAYLAMNPNGLVPTLREGDFILWESNAIVRYLATKFCRGTLAPDDPREFADADRWLDWQATALNPVMTPAFHGLLRAPGSRGAAEIEDSRAKTEAAMDILERHLQGRDFLAKGFTIADGAVCAAVHRWLNIPVRRAQRPALQAWYRRVMERPAAQATFRLPIT